MFGFAKLLASACVGILPCHFYCNIHVHVRIVIGRPKTYRIPAIRLYTERGFFILTLGLNILTVILNILNSTSDTHTSKRPLFGVNQRDLDGHWRNFIAIRDWMRRWVGVLLSCIPCLHGRFLMPYIRIIGEMRLRTCDMPEIGVWLINPDISNARLRAE